jgi:nucleotide-binding universal stress UspA family protein
MKGTKVEAYSERTFQFGQLNKFPQSSAMFNTLLVPLDGSSQSARVMDLATRVAVSSQATLHLLCVVDPSYFLPPENGSNATDDAATYPSAHAQTTFARSVLNAAAAQIAKRNFTVKQHLCAGNPADVVMQQAQLLAAEVVVMGHHHLSRLGRWANPSTCERVIELAPCPVLIETRDNG